MRAVMAACQEHQMQRSKEINKRRKWDFVVSGALPVITPQRQSRFEVIKNVSDTLLLLFQKSNVTYNLTFLHSFLHTLK
jgi:uncharacterized Fe-S cluster-containing radical SAM superfamily protein